MKPLSRSRYVETAVGWVGKPVLWGAKGEWFLNEKDEKETLPPETAFDCSGLCTSALLAIGGPDLRAEWNAQHFADGLLPTDKPQPGDFGIYGSSLNHVIHVVIALAGDNVLSADGATHTVRSLAQAIHRGAQVRVHHGTAWYRSEPFMGWRRNKFVIPE